MGWEKDACCSGRLDALVSTWLADEGPALGWPLWDSTEWREARETERSVTGWFSAPDMKVLGGSSPERPLLPGRLRR